MAHDLRRDPHHNPALPHIDPAADHHRASANPGLGFGDPHSSQHLHGTVEGEPGMNIHPDYQSKPKVPFKAKVEGYAKKIAGKTFGKEHEVAAGEARLRGEDLPKNL